MNKRIAPITLTLLLILVAGTMTLADMPDRPIITEVFTNPLGANDGPVGRTIENLHQEYIEIYLPPHGMLDPTMNKDALRLTFYEIEGDSSSSGNELVNYRIDLPTFDLDPSNGITSGAVARPTNGVVVIGWVDYAGNPPTDLAGTPSTRAALINGGVTAAADYLFVAINGDQFTGTTNFPVPSAVSSIDLPNEAGSGVIQNGSAAYLLVDRDATGYVELFDDRQVPVGGSADPFLSTGTVLGLSALLDGFAGNDHGKFDPIEQPYEVPTGDEIDLETVLPLGGAFSNAVPQIPEAAEHGYARLLADVSKTTEDASTSNDDPVADALERYRTISNVGPLFPTPGYVPFTGSAPALSVADASVQSFKVLAGTTGRPGVICANAGGNFAMQVTAVPGSSSDPAIATVATGDDAVAPAGQMSVYPSIAVTVAAATAGGAGASVPVTLTATNVDAGDPAVENDTGATTATVEVLNPLTGVNAGGAPFQATAFIALQGLPDQPGVLNEFSVTSLATYVAANLGDLVDDERHNGAALLNPATDLSNPLIVDSMEDDMPDDPPLFINAPSTAGLEDLVTTILTSAEVQAGNRTYEDNFNGAQTAVRAVELTIGETQTHDGAFVPTERIHYADAVGDAGRPDSGLTHVSTTRGFELALLDTNVQEFGGLESGQTDDFGLVVEVGRVGPGASVVSGEFIFLSSMGGLEGADIDTLDVPPFDNQTVIIYVDLDPLASVLGCETITRLFVIDGSGGSALNVIEAFSLNVRQPMTFDADDDGDVDFADYAAFATCLGGPNAPPGAGCDVHDANADDRIDLADFSALQAVLPAP